MFRVTRKGDRRVDIDLAGKLDSDAMRVALDELNEQSIGIEQGRMLYRIGDFALPTLGAMAVELARLPQLFRLVRRFERVALVADQQWLRKLSELEGALIPGVDIKGFEPEQEAEAEAWLEAR